MSIEQFQNKLNILTRRWWFYLIIFLIFLIPPYVSNGYQGTDRINLGISMLSKDLGSLTSIQPIFRIIPIILIITLIFLKNKVNRIFSIQAAFGENIVGFQKPKPWKYLFIPLAIFVFWFSINSITLKPDFNPIYLLTSDSGLAFCSMTPVYLTVFLFMYPRINKVAIRLTSFIGLIIGILAIVLAASNIWRLWWVGVTHLPLFIISLTCFVISLRKYS